MEELDLAAEIALAPRVVDGSGLPLWLGRGPYSARRSHRGGGGVWPYAWPAPGGPWSLEDAMNHLAGAAGPFRSAVIAALLQGREAVRALREDMRDSAGARLLCALAPIALGHHIGVISWPAAGAHRARRPRPLRASANPVTGGQTGLDETLISWKGMGLP